jgi:LmbE family N-acetylglucosaminyl deacetylase
VNKIINGTRRGLLIQASLLAGMASRLTVAGATSQETMQTHKNKLKVLALGAHPDDPESSCGGTMARYADLGHDVAALYLTRGEAGIKGKTAKEAADIRTAEAERACRMLKARPMFAGQIDGQTEVNEARYRQFREIIEAQKPDVLFAPWPIDSHRDHRAASLLAYDAWEHAHRSFELYYTEVDLGGETNNFRPTHYVDITAVVDRKRQACLAHISQDNGSFYSEYHETMQRFRGLEYGCHAAEAFVSAIRNPGRCSLPA